ncbi:hypothetical protein MRX96_018636 [Rhipicephalus microplus]
MEVDWRQLQTSVIDEVEKYPCVYNSNLISRWNAHSRAPYWGAVPTAVKVERECRPQTYAPAYGKRRQPRERRDDLLD